jgi:hypothetical protein
VRLAQRVLCALYVGVALVGVAVTPPVVVLTVAPAAGLVGAGLLAGLYRYCEQRPPGRRTLTTTAWVAAAVVPFHAGTQLLQGLGTALAVTVLVLVTLVGNYRVHQLPVLAPADPTRAGGAASYAELLRVMPLETVCTEWRALARGVGVPDHQRSSQDVAHVRALLLDEMQRRDPVGFDRWWREGAVGDPERHLQDGHGLAA